MVKDKLLIFGGAGLVGSRFLELFGADFELSAPTAEELDLTDADKTRKYIEEKKPKIILNFAAITNVDGAEDEKGDKGGLIYKVNSLAVKDLAEEARDRGIHFVHISTDYVFDGAKAASAYTEEDKPNPINWYGATKHFAEEFIQRAGGSFTIVRIAMPFSSHYEIKKDIARLFLERLQSNQEIKAISDSDISPTFVDDIAGALKILINKRAQGIYQCVSSTATTPYKFAKLIAQIFRLDGSLIKEISFNEYNQKKKAQLLRHSWMSNQKFVLGFGEGVLHTVEEALDLFKRQIESNVS